MDVPALMAEVNAAFKGEVLTTGADPRRTVRYWPTGIIPMDVLLGGGFPAGRSVEMFGDYSTLKSFIALVSIATIQKMGGTCAYLDIEHAFDPEWAAALGVNLSQLIMPPEDNMPETAEGWVKLAEILIRKQVDFIVVDSVASLFPQQYHEKAPGEDIQVAALARVMSNSLRRLNAINKRTAILYINQTRTNIGMTWGAATSETTPGGKALGFYASMRIRMGKAGKVTEPIKLWNPGDGKWQDAKEITAVKMKATSEKSKLNKPFRESWFVFDLRTGRIDEIGYLIAQGLEQGLITSTSAGHWTIPEILEGTIHGKDAFKEWLNDDEQEEVVEWLLGKMVPEVPVASTATPAAKPVAKAAAKKAAKKAVSPKSSPGRRKKAAPSKAARPSANS